MMISAIKQLIKYRREMNVKWGCSFKRDVREVFTEMVTFHQSPEGNERMSPETMYLIEDVLRQLKTSAKPQVRASHVASQ